MVDVFVCHHFFLSHLTFFLDEFHSVAAPSRSTAMVVMVNVIKEGKLNLIQTSVAMMRFVRLSHAPWRLGDCFTLSDYSELYRIESDNNQVRNAVLWLRE